MKKLVSVGIIVLMTVILLSCAQPQEQQQEPPTPQKSQTDIGVIQEEPEEKNSEPKEAKPEPTPVETFEPPKEHRVTISAYKFRPKNLVIKVGDTVVWENLGKTHHSLTSHIFQSKPLYQHDQFSHTFTSKGNHTYNSQRYPATQGNIVVESR